MFTSTPALDTRSTLTVFVGNCNIALKLAQMTDKDKNVSSLCRFYKFDEVLFVFLTTVQVENVIFTCSGPRFCEQVNLRSVDR